MDDNFAERALRHLVLSFYIGPSWDKPTWDAPGHAHHVQGVWDPDNKISGKAGQPCAKCKAWRNALELLGLNPEKAREIGRGISDVVEAA